MNTVLTGIAHYVPEDLLTNDDLAKMMDTSDEWIMARIGVKERHILKGVGLGSSHLGVNAVRVFFDKYGVDPKEIDALVCATCTPDHQYPSNASIIAYQTGMTNAFCFDITAACSGFLYGTDIADGFIKSGKYKKVMVVASEKLSSLVDYEDRQTAPIFGDGAAAALYEATEEAVGVMDTMLFTDGSGYPYLQIKGGGSKYPLTADGLKHKEQFMHQDGQTVFKWAVTQLAEVSAQIMERNGLTNENLAYLVPHQANLRIIDATARRCNMPAEKVMVNIQKYGNTSAATIPICLSEWESKLKKGDNLVLAAFGAGFTYGAIYLKWGYDPK